MSFQELLDQLKAQNEADVKSAHDKGFAEGIASVGGDKIYTQADLDQAVSAAKAAQKSEIKQALDQFEAEKLS